VPDSPRIEELKRRVQSDPASIAFAALAEEYRRGERYEEAIETCKAGLVRHPSYLSAHVTLGRAYIEVGRLQNAREELEYVLKLAPENLAAIRGLAEIHRRMGEDGGESHVEAPAAEPAPTIAVATPEVRLDSTPMEEQTEQPAFLEPAILPVPVVGTAPGPMMGVAHLSADGVSAAADTPSPSLAHVSYPSPVDPALAGLEEFLNAIVKARAERATAAR
jgi:tetratricopeptide (TPR) repeat protein